MDSLWMYGLPLVLIVGFMFVTSRNEKKRRKQDEEMKNNLKIGDEILTAGGMVGKVVEVSEENIVFETSADRVRIEIVKSAIVKKIEPTEEKA